jgi:hypothetical protein
MIRQAALGSALIALILAASPAPASAGPAPVRWTPCAAGFECASVSVPLDYDKPRGEQIGIALTRMRATDPARRIGSLVVNPGGPGLSGVAFHLQRNACVNRHVSDYLLIARPPAPGTVCRPDPPFPPSPAR